MIFPNFDFNKIWAKCREYVCVYVFSAQCAFDKICFPNLDRTFMRAAPKPSIFKHFMSLPRMILWEKTNRIYKHPVIINLYLCIRNLIEPFHSRNSSNIYFKCEIFMHATENIM